MTINQLILDNNEREFVGAPINVRGQLPKGQQVVIINEGNRSIIKAALWGIATFDLGCATLTTAGYTAWCGVGTMIALPVPVINNWFITTTVVLGITTLCLASLTHTCFKNTLWNLSSPQQTIYVN